MSINQRKRIFGKKVIDNNGKVFYMAGKYNNGGNEVKVYKNYDAFYFPKKYSESEIIYIDQWIFLDESNNKRLPENKIRGVTRKELVEMAGGEITARALFEKLSGESTLDTWIELCEDSYTDGHWIEAYWAYEKVNLPEIEKNTDSRIRGSVCLNEFLEMEWKDREYRRYCLDRLAEMDVIPVDTIKDVMGDFSQEEEMG